MQINCGSISSVEQSAIFASILDPYKPDVIFGSESHLNSDYTSSSVFPPGYTIHRADRQHSGGGGSFFAVNSPIPSYVVDELPLVPDDELLWVSLRMSRTKEILLCAFYKPPSASATRIDLLSQSVFKAYARNNQKHPHIVIVGDFNCGDIDWKKDAPIPTKQD